MNYLCHLYLSADEPLVRLGNLAGDFVKGRLVGRFHPDLERGLAQHRRLDAFAHRSPAFNRSRNRLAPQAGRYGGILVDLYYDHLLARHWPHYSPLPLAAFAVSVYADLERYAALLPPSFRPVAARMVAHDWLVSYRDPATLALVLKRMATRGHGHPPLATGNDELRRHAAGLEGDFFLFMEEATDWLQEDGAGSEG